MTKRLFPDGFAFGAATSAYQIEGAFDEDGRGKTAWDLRNRDEHGRPTGPVGDVACDHYHRYREDIALMQELGLQTYRFSISWVRIFPDGIGRINDLGVAFYDALIDALLAAGIRPAVTIWHGDLPLALESAGGWENRATIDAYLDYARFLFDHYGDRVKTWYTHNEPWCAAFLNDGPLARQLTIAHHLLIAHAAAVQCYRRSKYADGKIGIVLNLSPQYPASADPADVAAARSVDGFLNRWFLDPVLKGRYPADMVERYAGFGAGAPIRPGDMETLRSNPSDFLGINVYSRGVQKADSDNAFLGSKDRPDPNSVFTEMGWEVAPESLYDLLMDLEASYGVEIQITENGAAFKDSIVRDGVVQDDDRLAYYKGNLLSVARAIRHGCRVTAYYAWSLFDNFEWGTYEMKFGIVHIDPVSQKRTVKKSGLFYRDVIAARGLDA
ncbi:MAG TPA: beta-glucosidase [Acholeplasmatales bacterium]|nr:MAG: beta-glucosidase [Tenericutes bacterium GWF2_57_13]HAQ56297.1 beta-glucosidase [Acholeplasmatales bacterium]